MLIFTSLLVYVMQMDFPTIPRTVLQMLTYSLGDLHQNLSSSSVFRPYRSTRPFPKTLLKFDIGDFHIKLQDSFGFLPY
jgi:hypothetical protein